MGRRLDSAECPAPDVFVQDMPDFLAKKELEIPCLFEPHRNSLLTREFFTRINYEGYLFCRAEERARFVADPIPYCGLLTDPVSKRRFRPGLNSPSAVHEDVHYFFEGEVTARLFAKAPGDYRLPGYKMQPRAGVDAESSPVVEQESGEELEQASP